MRSVNLFDPRVKALAQTLASTTPETGGGGGWFKDPGSGTNPAFDKGLKDLAMQAADYARQQEKLQAMQQMYAAPGVATAQSGP